ncbi:MAG: hemin receptor [Alphaproteobacteria bacterium]|nr:MAG: hemin receptor [Alphaproteobacteria bacterium]
MTQPHRPPFIGPHEDRELELLLAGTKPLARLTSEPTVGFMANLDPFIPHVISGKLVQVDVPSEDGLTITHYFCLPTEEWRIKVLEVMQAVMEMEDKGGFTEDDLDRLDGTLLGYTKSDIEAFIAHIKR